MEETLRKKIDAQNEKGKTIRRKTNSILRILVDRLGSRGFFNAWFQLQIELKAQPPIKSACTADFGN